MYKAGVDPRTVSGDDVALLIPNDPAVFGKEVPFLDRLQNHRRIGFVAISSICRFEGGTGENIVKLQTGAEAEFVLHPLMDFLQHGCRHNALTNPLLISDNDCPKTVGFDPLEEGKEVGAKPKGLRFCNIAAAPIIDNAVSVKKYANRSRRNLSSSHSTAEFEDFCATSAGL